MPLAALHVYPLHACLISQLGERLLALPPEALAQAWVVLPTERLGTRLLAHLAAKRRAFFPPRIFTLANFLRAVAPPLVGTTACSAHALDFLIRSLLDGQKHVQAGHERELRLIFEELQAACIDDDALLALAQSLQEDIYRGADEMGSLAARLCEIHALFGQLRHHLASMGRSTEAQMFRHMVARATAALDETSERPWGSLWMVGFTSAVKATEPFLLRLCQEASCQFWFAYDQDLLPAHAPFSELVRLIQAHTRAEPIAVIPPPGERSHVLVLEADGPLEEVHAAVQRCEAAMAAGIDSSRLAIVVTDERLYGPCLRILEEQWHVKANLALPRSLLATNAGRHLSALLRCFENNEKSADFFAWLMTCPPRESVDEAMAANFSLEARRWLQDVFRLGILEDSRRLAEAAPSMAASHPLALRLRAIQVWITHRHAHRPFAQWLTSLREYTSVMLVPPGWGEGENGDEAEGMAREQITQLLSDLERFAAIATKPMPLAEFCRTIREKLGEMEVRGIGEPLAGLQVLSLPEARHMPFDHVVILGLNEGSFPKAIPNDELLDDYLKRRLGLPGWQALESMEDVTFQLLISRLPSFDLTRACRVQQEATVRSRFIERLALRHKVLSLPGTTSPWWSAGESLAWEPPLAAGLEGLVASQSIMSYFDTLSASALEKLLTCPYRFLMYQLGMESLRLPSQRHAAMREGEWQHAVLEALISGRQGRLVVAPPLNLAAWAASPDPVGFIHERLNDLTVKMAPRDFLDDPRSVSLMNISWERYARHLNHIRATAGPDTFLAFLRELRLGHRPLLTVGGRPRRMKGRIDAVDRVGALTVITDYKKNEVPSQRQVYDGSSPQLSVYALALQGDDGALPLSHSLIGYWSIRKGEWHPRAVGEEMRDVAMAMGLVTKKTPDLALVCGDMQQRWLGQEALVQAAQRFPATPGPHCARCDYGGVCRRKAGQVQEALDRSSQV